MQKSAPQAKFRQTYTAHTSPHLEGTAQWAFCCAGSWSFKSQVLSLSLSLSLSVSLIAQDLADIACNRWLAYWSTMEVSAEFAGGDTMSSMEFLGIYSVLSFGYILWNPVVLMAFMLGGMRAAVVQHRDLLQTVLRAPMEWFDV